MQEELISVIVPVYNVENYLQRCVESIQKQTYKNLEIILIDDGSRDTSGSLCDKLAESDARIQVIHKENGGLSDARNTGIRKSLGRYLLFVDSDDFVSEHYVRTLYDELRTENADVAICGYRVTEEDRFPEKSETSRKKWDATTALQNLLYQKYFTTSAVCKLYKRELWDGIEFPVGVLFEDTITIPKVLERTKTVVWSNAVLYGYYKRPGSITKSAYSPRLMEYEKVTAELLDYIDRHHPQLHKAALSRYVWANIYLWLQIPWETEQSDARIIEANIKKYRWTVFWDARNKTKNRLVVLLTLLGQKNFKKIYQWVS